MWQFRMNTWKGKEVNGRNSYLRLNSINALIINLIANGTQHIILLHINYL
jgi:hypothetical protein